MAIRYLRLHRCPGCDFECLTGEDFGDHLVARHHGVLPPRSTDQGTRRVLRRRSPWGCAAPVAGDRRALVELAAR